MSSLARWITRKFSLEKPRENKFSDFLRHEHLILKIFSPRPGDAYPLPFADRLEIPLVAFLFSMLYSVFFVLHCTSESDTGLKWDDLPRSGHDIVDDSIRKFSDLACNSYSLTFSDWQDTIVSESFNAILLLLLPRCAEAIIVFLLRTYFDRGHHSNRLCRSVALDLIIGALGLLIVYVLHLQLEQPDGSFAKTMLFMQQWSIRWFIAMMLIEVVFCYAIWLFLRAHGQPRQPGKLLTDLDTDIDADVQLSALINTFDDTESAVSSTGSSVRRSANDRKGSGGALKVSTHSPTGKLAR